MSLEITLHTPDGSRLAARHRQGDRFAAVDDVMCRHCGHSPLRIAGRKGSRIEGTAEHRGFIAETAGCIDCGETVGTIQVVAVSHWGRDEDDAILRGRYRVYG